MALSDDISAHIAAITELADTLASNAVNYASEAQTAAAGWTSTNPAFAAVPTITIPPSNDPSLTNMQLLYNGAFDSTFGSIKTYLDQMAEQWLARFFPEAEDCLRVHEDAWLCAVLQGNYTGIPAYVEEAIWNRARDRELRDSSRLQDEAVTAFAARGFSYPPGALNSVLLMTGQAEREKIASINREVAIKSIDVQIETIRFAVAQATQLRLGVQSALVGYLNAYLGAPQLGVARANGLAAAQASLWNASGAYYGAVVAAARTRSEVQMHNSAMVNRAQAVDVQAFVASTNARVNAALSSAQYFANAAAGALAALNTMSHIASIEYQ
jgi:hypothetical protein